MGLRHPAPLSLIFATLGCKNRRHVLVFEERLVEVGTQFQRKAEGTSVNATQHNIQCLAHGKHTHSQIGATLFTLLHPQSPSTPHIPTCHACTPAVHT